MSTKYAALIKTLLSIRLSTMNKTFDVWGPIERDRDFYGLLAFLAWNQTKWRHEEWERNEIQWITTDAKLQRPHATLGVMRDFQWREKLFRTRNISNRLRWEFNLPRPNLAPRLKWGERVNAVGFIQWCRWNPALSFRVLWPPYIERAKRSTHTHTPGRGRMV